jgi:hypothetical protein
MELIEIKMHQEIHPFLDAFARFRFDLRIVSNLQGNPIEVIHTSLIQIRDRKT